MEAQPTAVLGGGRSGLSSANLLLNQGVKVVLIDAKPLADSPVFSRLQAQPHFKFLLEKDALSQHFSQLIISPGIPLSHPLVKKLKSENTPIISELDLALKTLDDADQYPKQIIGITGTNGKSTTVSMIKHIFDELNIGCTLAGNIGIPLCDLLSGDIKNQKKSVKDILVLELSSYQLEQSNHLKCSTVGFLSFSPDHLARHKTIENYLKAKWRVFNNIKSPHLVLLAPSVSQAAKKHSIDVTPLNHKEISPAGYKEMGLTSASLAILGEHNLANAFTAVSTCLFVLKQLGIKNSDGQNFTKQSCLHALRTFKGLVHRLELVGQIGKTNNPRLMINDSKATNIESTLVALQAQTSPVTLFLGGEAKGNSFLPILQEKKHIVQIVSFGAAADQINQELSNHFPISSYKSLAAASNDFQNIVKSTKGALLFSPGCASFDEFDNFEDRGDFFRKTCLEYIHCEKS